MSAEATATTIAATLENTSLKAPSNGSKPDSADEGADAPDQNQDEAATPTKEGRRLHLRNIAYATDEGELKAFFNDFEVTAVKIPQNPRTNRPLGYAFVDVVSADMATQAIADLNGKELSGRVISITHADGRGSQSRTRGVRARGRSTRARGRGGRSSRPPRTGTAENEASGDNAPLADITNKPTDTSAANQTEGRKSNPRQHKRGTPENGIPSATKIMVANIPFETEEEQLKKFFAEYEPQDVSIALQPIPRFMIKKLAARQERRKGRGFAFITLSSHEMQEKACAEKNGAEFLGREIAVKVAIDSPDKVGNKEAASADENVENAVVEQAAEAAPAA